jgi:hypothetical protein
MKLSITRNGRYIDVGDVTYKCFLLIFLLDDKISHHSNQTSLAIQCVPQRLMQYKMKIFDVIKLETFVLCNIKHLYFGI